MKGNKKISYILKETRTIDRREAELLLAHILQTTREHLLAHDEEGVSFFKRLQFNRAIRKRIKGFPIAYITGTKEFFDLTFFVNKHTLVPRPETELIVEQVVEKVGSVEGRKIILIDVGTGSGCIPVSILRNTKKIIETYAIDISSGALRVAKKNAQKHGVSIDCRKGNLLDPVISILEKKDTHSIITANLPYVTQEDYEHEPSIQKEPKSALVADDNGLALYKKLLAQLSYIKPGCFSLFMEINHEQKDLLVSEIKKYLPSARPITKTDLAGHERLVFFTIHTHSCQPQKSMR